MLLVEDEFLISEWIAQSLSEQGFSVQAVSNARRAREMQPQLAVVYASARANMLNAPDRVPGSSFVPKPYEPKFVGRLLAAALEAGARVPA